jgi:hypothetical protein
VGWDRGDPSKPFVALFNGAELSGNRFNGYVRALQYNSTQSGSPAAPPVSSDPAHLSIDSSSDDISGLFTLQGYSPGASVSVDVTYTTPYPNGSRVRLEAADDTAATLPTDLNDGSGLNTGMAVYVDASNTSASKFRVKNTTSDKTPAGSFYYFVSGF